MSLYSLNQDESSIWNMKYRPKTIDECVLPQHTKDQFNGMLEQKRIPNLLLASPTAGTGKTTSAMALCRALGYDVLFINASLENSIDDIRNTIVGFCSSMSLDGNPKAVLLDEVEFLSQNAMASLRGVIEQHSNVSFILTCNYAQKLIEPIRSRCATIEFKIPEDERKDLLKQFLMRVFKILDSEQVEYDKKVVVEFVQKYFPDYRKVLNELQRYAAGGKIDAGILSVIGDTKTDVLLDGLKSKDFSKVRKWIGENSGLDFTTFYGKFHETLYDHIVPSSIPPAVLHLAKYQYQAAFVADQQLNLTACMLEIMAECQFK